MLSTVVLQNYMVAMFAENRMMKSHLDEFWPLAHINIVCYLYLCCAYLNFVVVVVAAAADGAAVGSCRQSVVALTAEIDR